MSLVGEVVRGPVQVQRVLSGSEESLTWVEVCSEWPGCWGFRGSNKTRGEGGRETNSIYSLSRH